MPSVVLPDPDLPTMPSVSPLFSSRLTLSTATSSRICRLNMPAPAELVFDAQPSVCSTTALSGGTGFGRPEGSRCSSFFV